MKAYLFPGQGVQCVGMGRALYDASASMRARFQQADRLLEMKLTELMFNGPADTLKETTVAQPAIFLCSILLAETLPFPPAAVAGHSLGELTALVASKFLSFEDGLALVTIRARAMQEACHAFPGAMAAVLGLADEAVEAVCASIVDEIVVPANYNCPGQLVISGSKAGVARATKALLQAGARRVIALEVEGGFHSPLMEMAQERLRKALASISFSKGICPHLPKCLRPAYNRPRNHQKATGRTIGFASLLDQNNPPYDKRWHYRMHGIRSRERINTLGTKNRIALMSVLDK